MLFILIDQGRIIASSPAIIEQSKVESHGEVAFGSHGYRSVPFFTFMISQIFTSVSPSI